MCTYLLSWEIDCTAPVVIILDSQRYDGQERRYIDYTIPDMLQMIGRVGRPKDSLYQPKIADNIKEEGKQDQIEETDYSSNSVRWARR